MAPLARYPDAASLYWIEHRSGSYRVHHEREGLIAECDCLGEARNQIADAEDEAEALDAADASLVDLAHERGADLLNSFDRRAA